MTTETIELQPLPAVASLNISGFKDTLELSNRLSEPREAIDSLNVPEDASATISSEGRPLSKLQLAMTILQPSLINFFGSFTTGIITIGLPVIASSISLQRSLYLWPSSVYNLTSGATLLIAGSIADIVGARHVEVCGIFLIGIFVLAAGFSQTGVQLVVFRALQGIALAMHIPASVSIIAAAVPAGRARNIGFSCLGLSQPLGFSFGMVTSGIMIERIGWRSGFYLSGAAILTAAAASWLTLPKMKTEAEGLTIGKLLKKLWKEVDLGWSDYCQQRIGIAVLRLSVSKLRPMGYLFSQRLTHYRMVSAELSVIRSATTASLLAVSLVLLIAFPLWMRYSEHKGRSALVPNSLWKNLPFASICALVALSSGAMNSMEIFSSL